MKNCIYSQNALLYKLHRSKVLKYKNINISNTSFLLFKQPNNYTPGKVSWAKNQMTRDYFTKTDNGDD